MHNSQAGPALTPLELSMARAWAVLRVRMGNRQVRTLIKSQQYRAVALAGGGTREVARRARQIAKGAV